MFPKEASVKLIMEFKNEYTFAIFILFEDTAIIKGVIPNLSELFD